MKFLKISQQNKILICGFIFLLLAYLLFKAPIDNTVQKNNETVYADTLIPKGYVLIPIDLANSDTVSALMDQYGVVDLYAGAASMQGSKKIASKVKILRAPLNPNQYAVLIPEQKSNAMMNAHGPFWAVVQNRNTKSEDLDSTQKVAKQIRIEYNQDGVN